MVLLSTGFVLLLRKHTAPAPLMTSRRNSGASAEQVLEQFEYLMAYSEMFG